MIQAFVGEKLLQQGRSASDQLGDDCDLLVEGYIDSMGVVELTAHLESHFGSEIDYDDLDPEQMTILGPLAELGVVVDLQAFHVQVASNRMRG